MTGILVKLEANKGYFETYLKLLVKLQVSHDLDEAWPSSETLNIGAAA